MERINSFQKKVRQQKIGTYIFLPLTAVFIITMGIIFYEPIYFAGIMVTVLAMILAIVQFHRIGPVNVPFTPGADTKEFLRKQLDQFKALDNYSLKFLPVYILLVWLGQVICYFAMFTHGTLKQRITAAVVFGISMAIAFFFIFKRSRKRMFNRYQPMKEDIQANLSQLEDQEGE